MTKSVYFDYLHIRTAEGKHILLNPVNAYPPKRLSHNEDMSSEEQWYQQFVNELPELGEEYMELFIDCLFSPANFIEEVRKKGGVAFLV